VVFGAGPESYANGEEVYSLIAGLIALQGRPDILATAKLDFIALPRQAATPPSTPSSPSSAPRRDTEAPSRIDDDRLCALFFEKLITHRSLETFHSNQADDTLTGILRVLLVLVDGQPGQRRFVGSLRGHPPRLRRLARTVALSSQQEEKEEEQQEEDEGLSVIEYLYSRCLFPKKPRRSTASQGPARADAAACLSPISRKLAYALLLEVCGNNYANMTALVGVMSEDGTQSAQEAASGACRQDLLVGITDSLGSKRFGVDGGRSPQEEAKSPPRPSKVFSRSMLQWEYDPNVLVKKPNMYLGLVNQGCTCYMNAFLQQLFHVEAFTDAFLAIESNVGSLGDDVDDYTKDNSVAMFELQILFCYLRLSQKKYCDTIAFAKVFKDYDAEPIRLGEQKDGNEFASMLFDKLESNQACKSLIQDKFGGELVWQVISTDEDCAYKSEREEPYFMLTAEVGGKNNLEDSLELYVAGEMLSGDNKIEVEVLPEDSAGEITKRKVDALRRCAIRTLPSVLIVHLKRFEFDFETLHRRKLNDLFTFPTELDMFPYTEAGLRREEARKRSRTQEEEEGGEEEEEGQTEEEEQGEQPRGYYQYTLKGVIVHTGAIDSGHYYSFIRVRRQGGRGSAASDPSEDDWEWMEFNDTTVSPFSVDSIPSECFGGPVAGDVGSGEQRWKQHSAYMLIYERTNEAHLAPKAPPSSNDHLNGVVEEKQPECHEAGEDFEGSRLRTASMSLDCLDRGAGTSRGKPDQRLRRAPSTSQAGVSPSVLSAVDAETSSFLLDLTRFSRDYILFHWKLLQASVLGDSLDLISRTCNATDPAAVVDDSLAHKVLVTRTIYLSLAFCFQVLFRARGQQCIPPFVEKWEELLTRDESGFCATVLLSEWTREPVCSSGTVMGGAQ
jgi:ubiquitin C-terminal hydrolase